MPVAVPCRPKISRYLGRLADLMLCLDSLAGTFLGYVSVELYFHRFHGQWHAAANLGAVWREILLGSLIAALLMREVRPAGSSASSYGPTTRELVSKAAVALSILLSIGLATRTLDDMARIWVFSWLTLFAAYVGISRSVLLMHLGRLERTGKLREAVAVLGAPDVASRTAARLAAEVDIVTVIDEFDDEESIGSGSLLGELRNLVGEGAIDTVILAVGRHGDVDLAPLLEQLKSVPVEIAICEDYGSAAPLHQRAHSMRMLAGLPVSVVAELPLAEWALFQKAALDKIGAILLIMIVSPVMLAAALAIVWEDAGPIFFYQKRNGWSGRTFTICKFRTMRVSASGNYLRQTEKNDPRCTAVGRFLRRTSIDELPQLWNVLCGDMSLVGPRPHMDSLHINQREGCELLADYAQRQRVKPGLTGWAQVHGCRGAVSSTAQMQRRLQYDLYYIEHWSIWLDLQILARTPLCVMVAENAF